MKNRLEKKTIIVPDYQREFYSWVYTNQKLCKFLDKPFVCNLLSFGNRNKMISSCVAEIEPKDTVLQMGLTFGSQIEAVAEKIGIYGEYDIADVSPTQIKRCRDKYEYKYPFMHFISQDASEVFEKKYDVVLCYMLLHEVPPVSRKNIINNALASVSPKGKVIFIDYNKPSKWQILAPIVKLVNRLYQPFAENMWMREIRADVKDHAGYNWRKKTFFGSMYQKLIVSKKDSI